MLAQTTELTARGQYDISLTASVTGTDGGGLVGTFSASIEFTVIVYPCPVTSFETVPDSFAPIDYTLGDSANFIFGEYALTQDRDCGYSETVTVSGLPSAGFLVHQEDQ